MKDLDIIIPVYDEGENIPDVLKSLQKNVKTSFRVLICYDKEEDNTLPIVKAIMNDVSFPIVFVKNIGHGVHKAVTTGFDYSDSPAILVFPADDTENSCIIDKMYEKFRQGNDIVAASRFMEGGCMRGCPWLKSLLVRWASFTLHRLASIPIKDASNGFRLFSRKVLDTILIESTMGFTYSLELLVKCHRMHWSIAEVPASWHERDKGESHFHLFKWLPHYLRWYFYGFSTEYLNKAPSTIKLKR
jgi:glycosyltransferase involved in cell wall biosynthesis